MIVNFSPMRFEAPITLARQGDLLMIDGDEIDLATYPVSYTHLDVYKRQRSITVSLPKVAAKVR